LVGSRGAPAEPSLLMPARGSLFAGPASAGVQGGSKRARSKRRGAAAADGQACFVVCPADEATVRLAARHQRGSNGGQLCAAISSLFSLSLFSAGDRRQQSKRREQVTACCFADTLAGRPSPPTNTFTPTLVQAACMFACLLRCCQSSGGVVLNNTSCLGFVSGSGRREPSAAGRRALKRARHGCGAPAGCPWA
jgi:hypothetical protein